MRFFNFRGIALQTLRQTPVCTGGLRPLIERLEGRQLFSSVVAHDHIAGSEQAAVPALDISPADIGNHTYTLNANGSLTLSVPFNTPGPASFDLGSQVFVHLAPTAATGSPASLYVLTTSGGTVMSSGYWEYSQNQDGLGADYVQLNLLDTIHSDGAVDIPQPQPLVLRFDSDNFFSGLGSSGSFSVGPLAVTPDGNQPTPGLPGAGVQLSSSGGLPGSVYRGEEVKVKQNIEITNLDPVAIRGVATVEVILSDDATYSQNDLTLATTSKLLSVKPNRSKSVPVKIRGELDYLEDTYYVLVKVQLPGGSTTGTIAQIGMMEITPSSVDLGIQIAKPPTGAFAKSSRATTLVVIQNTGNTAVNREPVISAYASDGATIPTSLTQHLGSVSPRLKLKPGQSKTLKLKLAAPPALAAGSYFLTVVLSPAGQTNPDNDISVSPLPILVV